MENNKGKLIEAFVECSLSLIELRKRVEDLAKQKESLANAISLDGELSELIIAGGIHTVGEHLITLDTVTHQLEVKSTIASYNIKSELTSEQLEVLENGK